MNLLTFFRQAERQHLAAAVRKQILLKSKLGKGIFLFLILLFGHHLPGRAQRNFSVQIISNFTPPFSPFLSDYGYPQAMNVNIILRGRTSYSGFLRIRLESIDGRGIVLQTRSTYNPVVDLGPSQTFTGVELAPYFAQENLDFVGYDRQQYLRTKRLPDGLYKLTFSFFDRFRPEVRVSNLDILSQKVLRIFILQAPVINLPMAMSTVNPSNLSTQPVPINWMRPANTPFSPEYELIINELRPSCQEKYSGITGNNAAASRISQGELSNCLGPEIYRTTTTALNYNYGMQAEPLLKLGAWYAARIRARDPQGRTLFINNGVSKIRVFRYGKPCPVPPRVKVTAQSPYQVQLDWDALPNHTGYTVYSKRQGERYRWYKQTALSNRAQVKGLEPGVYYSFRVTADCNASTSKESATYDIRMPNVPPSPVECGKSPAPIDLSNQNPIQSLKVGDKIMAADFEFTLVEVRPLGGGYFAGKAYTKIKLFKGARVFARFSRIRVNTDRRLIAGEMTTDGVGTQVIPEEWSQEYLSFTNEINRLFGEIEKGLDKVDALLGKIDEVLKKVEEWVQNYQGEDKQELLETIRIGKKEIEEGKKELKEGDPKEGLKKLKDGSGKVLGVGGKMVKEALETLFRDLKDLVKEVLDRMKKSTKSTLIQNKKDENKQRDKEKIAINQIRLHRKKIKINTIRSNENINTHTPINQDSISSPVGRVLDNSDLENIKNQPNIKDWIVAGDSIRILLEANKVLRFKWDTLQKMTGKDLLVKLTDNIKDDIKKMGENILNNFLNNQNSTKQLKTYIQKYITEVIRKRIALIYKTDD